MPKVDGSHSQSQLALRLSHVIGSTITSVNLKNRVQNVVASFANAFTAQPVSVVA